MWIHRLTGERSSCTSGRFLSSLLVDGVGVSQGEFRGVIEFRTSYKHYSFSYFSGYTDAAGLC